MTIERISFLLRRSSKNGEEMKQGMEKEEIERIKVFFSLTLLKKNCEVP